MILTMTTVIICVIAVGFVEVILSIAVVVYAVDLVVVIVSCATSMLL